MAFYLPQYHEVPENSAWWGPGFTDWVNVEAATPRFPGHGQPRLPGELGRYDLTDPAVRQRQADLAREHRVDAFCYYHYWFSGRRLLERPFEAVLASGQPELPFCLCWANEPWTRRWDGGDRHVLVPQAYSADDDTAHGRWLARAFADPRYLRVDGRPVFLVYRAGQHPDIRRATDTWRTEAQRAGVGDPLLCRVESFPEETGPPDRLGFDVAVQFTSGMRAAGSTLQSVVARLRQRAGWAPSHIRFDYGRRAERAMAAPAPPYPRFPCVMPGWDNTPRRPRSGVVFHGATPAAYERWLRHEVRRAAQARHGDSLVFVNAWNEWAEGATLEPTAADGRAYLRAHRRAMDAAAPMPAATDVP